MKERVNGWSVRCVRGDVDRHCSTTPPELDPIHLRIPSATGSSFCPGKLLRHGVQCSSPRCIEFQSYSNVSSFECNRHRVCPPVAGIPHTWPASPANASHRFRPLFVTWSSRDSHNLANPFRGPALCHFRVPCSPDDPDSLL